MRSSDRRHLILIIYSSDVSEFISVWINVIIFKHFATVPDHRVRKKCIHRHFYVNYYHQYLTFCSKWRSLDLEAIQSVSKTLQKTSTKIYSIQLEEEETVPVNN